MFHLGTPLGFVLFFSEISIVAIILLAIYRQRISRFFRWAGGVIFAAVPGIAGYGLYRHALARLPEDLKVIANAKEIFVREVQQWAADRLRDGVMTATVLLGIAVIVNLIADRHPSAKSVECPHCHKTTERAGYHLIQILTALLFFPIGLLVLLMGRQSTICIHCHSKFKTL